MASQLGELPLDKPDRAQVWLTAFQALARAKGWSDSTEKKTIADNFLAICGLTALEKLQSLVSPRPLTELSFEDIQTTFVTYLRPKEKLIIAERARFFKTQQLQGESISDFVSRLRQAATDCKFDDLKACRSPSEELISTALIAGLRDSREQQRVLEAMQLKLMSVSEITDFIRNLEQVDGFVARQMDKATGQSKSPCTYEATLHYAQSGRPETSQHASSRRTISACRYCGKSHPEGRCPAFGKSCSKCGKKNHFSTVCKSRSMHYTTTGEEDSDSAQQKTDVLHLIDALNSIEVSMETVRINDKPFKMQIDTGASVSVLSSAQWALLGKPSLMRSNRRLEAFDGHVMKSLGKVTATVELRGRLQPVELIVVSSEKTYGLLGRDLLESDGVFHASDVQAEKTAVEPLPCIRGVKARMELVDGAKPQFCRARAVPLALESQISAELDRLHQLGVIEPTEGPVSNASPVVWVKKKDGTLRMCADYSVHVNSKIKSDSYPIPHIETMFSKLKNAKTFATVDLRSAYWQIELDEAARDLSVINTSRGLYRVNRLQMGMKNASFIFQRTMESILGDIKGLLIYQDDILIHAPDKPTLEKRLAAVRTRLSEKRVTINEAKSISYCDSVSFLGFRISAAGIQPDDRLVEKIRHVCPPANKSELAHFLGLVNFFGRLIPNFAGKTAPLNRLRQASVPFVWSEECSKAFESLKLEIASAPVVQPYSLTKELTLTTDASKGALAAVATQDGHPVIYVSRSLSSAESNYSNIEREALAIVWAIARLKHYFHGRPFTIRTDHQPLIRLFGSGSGVPVDASARIGRWALYLMQFDYRIQYARGSSIPHVDALSRLRFDDSSSDDKATFETINSIAFESPVIDAKRITAEMELDALTQRIPNRVRQGDWRNCSQAEAQFKKVSNKLTLENGLLYMQRRVFIPPRLRKAAFDAIHDTHTGMHAAHSLMSTSCWWPGMQQDVAQFVRRCPDCCRLRPQLGHDRDRWPPSTYPFQRVHMDWAYVKGAGNILVIVDSFSGWIEAFPCRDRTADSVIQCLRAVFTRFGVPELVVSDNAPEFTTEVLTSWLRANGAKKLESPTYYPQANGAAERAVQTVKSALRAWSEKVTHMEFSRFLQKVLLHHRNSVSSRGCCPAEILFGRRLRVPVVTNFEQGDSVIYAPSSSSVGNPAKFVMTAGQNTAWILADDGLRLASTNQLAPMATRPSEFEMEDEDETNSVPETGNEPVAGIQTPVPEEAVQLRRSLRNRSAPERFVP
ncbi:hypothetical protein BOX15_Mlig029604g7 [Macrostomum lignano]|uniref:RNA-directed DNA polymerase n=1 Tax=Macrostomum lignano TaxID=282301 RepID=A0A267G4H6_9PLAT|nr:hypothetical protein BOX15_Mlig029604g7 [Macrostomum lignano]